MCFMSVRTKKQIYLFHCFSLAFGVLVCFLFVLFCFFTCFLLVFVAFFDGHKYLKADLRVNVIHHNERVFSLCSRFMTMKLQIGPLSGWVNVNGTTDAHTVTLVVRDRVCGLVVLNLTLWHPSLHGMTMKLEIMIMRQTLVHQFVDIIRR